MFAGNLKILIGTQADGYNTDSIVLVYHVYHSCTYLNSKYTL